MGINGNKKKSLQLCFLIYLFDGISFVVVLKKRDGEE